MMIFGICLLIFFSCIVGSINECDDSCSTTNHDLNKTGLSFGVIGLVIALIIIGYSGFIIKTSS